MTAAERIYLDHAATTPVRPEVLEAMLPYFTQAGYNPSSVHAEGRRARAALDDARDRVAALLGCARKEIVFTGGGSEADTQAILGIAAACRERGRHVVSSTIEHHAVLHALDALRDDGGEVTLLPVDSHGRIDRDAFGAALRHDTVLASIMYANNEIGAVAPIADFAHAAHAAGVLFHTDAVQAAGWLSLDVAALGVDLLSLSAHKFHGPKGVGVLYARSNVVLPPLIQGGGQEFGRRSGTENVAGIVGLAIALELADAERSATAQRIGALRDRFEAQVTSRISGIRVNAAQNERLPNNANLSIEGVDSEALVVRLDLEGVAVSAGSACTSGAIEPSHVIAALGLPPQWQRGVVRFSLGPATTRAQIDRVAELLPRVVAQLRGNGA